jgi:hypothetical protein
LLGTAYRPAIDCDTLKRSVVEGDWVEPRVHEGQRQEIRKRWVTLGFRMASDVKSATVDFSQHPGDRCPVRATSAARLKTGDLADLRVRKRTRVTLVGRGPVRIEVGPCAKVYAVHVY